MTMQRREVKTRRKALKWNQQELGVAAGIPATAARVQINRVENTEYPVSIERLAAIEAAITKEETTRKQFAAFQAALQGN